MSRMVAVVFVAMSAASLAAAEPEAATKSHIAAAEELANAFGADNANEAGLAMLRVILQQNPDLAPYENIIKSWFMGIVESEAFKAQSRDIYIKHFTESELRQITQFYRTEVGKKLARSLPVIAKESSEASARFIQEHLPELQAKLAEAKDAAAKQKAP
jgi:uncharacterized protein